jgi:hypothetical protein
MKNKHHPDDVNALAADLAEAEADLEALINRAQNALPTLFYIIEDNQDWRRDVRATIHRNLMEAVDKAQTNQRKRRHRYESPSLSKNNLPKQTGVSE